jgi:predicted lipoprotein with Yx(FWY)xxD motif
MTSRFPCVAMLSALLAAVVLAGCGSDSGSTAGGGGGATNAPPSTSTPSETTSAPAGTTSAPAAGADLAVADSPLGKIVVDSKGMTAYYFTKDTPNSGKSACQGPCLQAWPPITTASDTPQASEVTGQLGTITLPDGKKQITVNGMPIYLFAKDTKPGDVSGQGVNNVWYVLDAAGTMITTAPTGS